MKIILQTIVVALLLLLLTSSAYILMYITNDVYEKVTHNE